MTHSPPWIVVGATDVGRRRARNEDSFVVLPDVGVAVVADGMGGHPGGDVASHIAARAAAEFLSRALPNGSHTAHDDPAPTDPSSTTHPTPDARERAMHRSVLAAHEAVLARSRAEPRLAGMGTTTVAVALDSSGAGYTVGNVGDSRVYRWADGSLTQLTRDDTWLEDRIDAGHIRREDAGGHPEGHLLTQCIGLSETPTPRVQRGTLQPGETLLLCSDGLIACLTDQEIAAVLRRHLDGTEEGTQRAVRALIDEANTAGGVDNITTVLLTVR